MQSAVERCEGISVQRVAELYALIISLLRIPLLS